MSRLTQRMAASPCRNLAQIADARDRLGRQADVRTGPDAKVPALPGGLAVLTILRSIVLAIAYLVALSTPAPADQWDDLAQKFVAQEHARLVRRAADKDGIVIVMEHKLVTERVVLVVTDKKPAISFQFKSAALPGDDAFDLMARGSSLVTGKDAAAAMRLLRQSCTAAGAKDPGVATASAGWTFRHLHPAARWRRREFPGR